MQKVLAIIVESVEDVTLPHAERLFGWLARLELRERVLRRNARRVLRRNALPTPTQVPKLRQEARATAMREWPPRKPELSTQWESRCPEGDRGAQRGGVGGASRS